ncbi:MAG: FCD domain-containing protein [Pseudonocardiaceae bacterium]|nr:FCD domain-containing protein [Pseudonocardiaceae bacterium]
MEGTSPEQEAVTDSGPVTPTALDPYEQLKEAIYLGDLQPGQHLVETSLAQSFRVSRTPIREALTRLEQDGLVVRSRMGLTVRERSPGEILDIYEVRILLEGAAGRTAAERRNNNDIFELRKAHRRYLAAGDKDQRVRVAANRAFHQVVWNAAHQPALADLLYRIELQLGRFPVTTLSYPGRWETSIEQHEALVAAIEAREGEKAAEIASQHFADARDIRLVIWENEI